MIHFEEILGGHETRALGGRIKPELPQDQLCTTEWPSYDNRDNRSLDPSIVQLIGDSIEEETLYRTETGGKA